MTRAEHRFVSFIKQTIEQGHVFNAERFCTLVCSTPRDELEITELQRCVAFVREEVRGWNHIPCPRMYAHTKFETRI